MADENPTDPVLFVRVPREMHDRVNARVADLKIPVAEWVRRVIAHALDEPVREYTVPTVERV
jgi:hypothetical protein